ncbi:MAG TPA: sulfite exporter TauE/SafE family protein, partial [Stellaceae bacterium]|nr:sulfite exporter TauE/SafE family protein [Stellaceae bacterium]
LVLGVLVTLSSVGAGAIGMTALVLLYPRTPIAKLVGSDIAHAVPLTLIGGIGHWFLGSVNWLLLSSLLIGSLPGIYVGSHFAARVPEKILRPVLAVTLMLVGIRMLRS